MRANLAALLPEPEPTDLAAASVARSSGTVAGTKCTPSRVPSGTITVLPASTRLIMSCTVAVT